MKKRTGLPALLLCLSLLSGCGAQAILHDVAEQLQNAHSEPEAAAAYAEASSADAAPDDPLFGGHADGREPDGEEAVSATDAVGGGAPQSVESPPEEAAADFTVLALGQCVTDADGAAGKLPRITLDCPGARDINEDIEGSFRYLVDADYCTLYYDASINGRVLSVLIAQLFDGDSAYYTPYLLDLATGERLSGEDLLDLMGLSAADVTAAELRIMGDEFEYQYGSADQWESAAFYEEQRDRTVSAENAETGRLWLSGAGELYFVAKIFSLAGAEFYEYPMAAGFMF